MVACVSLRSMNIEFKVLRVWHVKGLQKNLWKKMGFNIQFCFGATNFEIRALFIYSMHYP